MPDPALAVSQRELLILDLVTRPGGGAKLAAAELGLSEERIRGILHEMYRRYGVSSAAQLARVLRHRLP